MSFTIGICLWLTYGLATRQGPVILSNAVTLALQCAILFLKVRYAREHKRALRGAATPERGTISWFEVPEWRAHWRCIAELVRTYELIEYLRGPDNEVHALQLIDQNGSLYLANCDRQRKGIRFSRARQRTHHRQATGAVVTNIRKHQRRSSLGLFASTCGSKSSTTMSPASGTYDVTIQTTSFPTSGPVDISP